MWHSRDPEGLNKKFQLFDLVTPEKIQNAANKYFTDQRLVVVTLANEKLPDNEKPKGTCCFFFLKVSVSVRQLFAEQFLGDVFFFFCIPLFLFLLFLLFLRKRRCPRLPRLNPRDPAQNHCTKIRISGDLATICVQPRRICVG